MSPISKTRSGKSYGLQLQDQKKSRCCSYCGKSGHNISKCKDQNLDNLEKKARGASIFGDCIVDGTSKFLKVWLNTLTNIELRALGYRFYSMEDLISDKNLKIEEMNQAQMDVFWNQAKIIEKTK